MKALFLQSMTISFTRIVLLMTPILYVFIISNYDNHHLEHYILSTQFTQIELVILVSLNIGTNIILAKQKQYKDIYSYCYGGLFYLSLLLSLCFSILSVHLFDDIVNYFNLAMLLSMPLSALYLVATSILESKGKEKIAFNISLLSLLFNCLILLFTLWIGNQITYWIIGIAILTKGITLACSAFCIKTYVGDFMNIKFNPKVLKEMLAYGIPEALTSLVFTSSIFISLYIMHYQFHLDVSMIGISLNYKNIISMFFIGYCISYTINNAAHSNIKLTTDSLFSLCVFYTICVISMILLLPIFSFLYSVEKWNLVMHYLIVSIFIVLFDAIGIFFVSHLRINGFKKYPPLLRLSFAFIGVPIGLIWAYLSYSDYDYLWGLLIGNALFALFAFASYFKLLRRSLLP